LSTLISAEQICALSESAAVATVYTSIQYPVFLLISTKVG